jgi:subfamily B ATP-binding cassette protein MsbA
MKNLHFLALLRPFRFLIIGAVLSLVIFTNLGLLMPWMLKIIIDRVLGSSDLGYLYIILGSIVLVYAIREIFFYISHYLIYYVAQRIMFDVRKKLFKHLQNLSLRFYEEYRTGKLISNILTDVAMLQQMFSATLVNLAVNFFMILFILCVLFAINSSIASICLVMLPLQLMNFMYFKGHIKKGTLNLREKMSEISANLSETINGVRVVKSFSKERTENKNFVSQLRPAFNLSIDVAMKGVHCWIIADIINISSVVIVLGTGGYFVSRGKMTLGDFVAFYTYLGMLVAPIVQLSGLSTAISQGLAGAARIIKLLDTIPDIKESENPIFLDEISGNVEFKDVDFGYNGKLVLKNFSLKINPGQKVALVGPSGSGKSTIANLLLRFYDINNGEVLIDNKDIKKLNLESFRGRIGVVLQEPFLFSGTIEENIAYAKNDASKAEIKRAAKMANVEEFVDKLENGYKTEIGENGTMLSGGQKQRIAIARAILRNPRILILDEATSALDTVSEYLVQEALDNLMRNRTTIIIAHRLSTVKNADMIVVMEEGKIRQTGSHEELISVDGLYSEMYKTQEEIYNNENEEKQEIKPLEKPQEKKKKRSGSQNIKAKSSCAAAMAA